MKTEELFNFVTEELNSRDLKCNARFNALEHVREFVRKRYNNDMSCFQQDKKCFKQEYEKYKNSAINGAESSAINEIYNQYMFHVND